MIMDESLRQLKAIQKSLESIDTSLQLLVAQKNGKITTAFVSKKVTIDKLIHQGIASGGKSGLVESVHYCKTDPDERNSSKFLFDPHSIIQSAWNNFKNV